MQNAVICVTAGSDDGYRLTVIPLTPSLEQPAGLLCSAQHGADVLPMPLLEMSLVSVIRAVSGENDSCSWAASRAVRSDVTEFFILTVAHKLR